MIYLLKGKMAQAADDSPPYEERLPLKDAELCKQKSVGFHKQVER
jgi:hypothetical protein